MIKRTNIKDVDIIIRHIQSKIERPIRTLTEAIRGQKPRRSNQ